MLGDEQHAEVVGQERVHEGAERHQDEYELAGRCRTRQRHPFGAAERGADQRERPLNEGEAQRDGQRELTELWNH
jgi:hypothetical protein